MDGKQRVAAAHLVVETNMELDAGSSGTRSARELGEASDASIIKIGKYVRSSSP